MARPGPRKVRAYSNEFKLTAIRMSQQPGMQVQAVAAALEIHPFLLSRWRRQARLGALRGRTTSPGLAPKRELKRLQDLERAHRLLQEEHALLKKVIRFCFARRPRRSRSSRVSAAVTD